MKKLKVYQYPKCSTCVKALKFLRAQGVDFDSVDITEQAPTKSELKRALERQNGELKKLFNISGVQYRELKVADRLKDLSRDAALSLLAGNGRLVKRPFVIGEDLAIVGFNESEWQKIF